MGNGLVTYDAKDALQVSLGRLGFDVLTSGTHLLASYSNTVRWVALMADSLVSFNASSTIGDDVPSGTRSEGRVVFGDFDSITVDTTGTVLAYRG